MPTSTSVFKIKWNNLIKKLSPHDLKHRRDSTSTENRTTVRKYSDSMSVGTFDSNITIADKLRNVFPNLFQRRSSTASTSNDDHEYFENLERLQALYVLAIDELAYAEDSQGSSYYSGDLEAAREAINDCLNTFFQLLERTMDPITREGLESSISPKLFDLKKQLHRLPKLD